MKTEGTESTAIDYLIDWVPCLSSLSVWFKVRYNVRVDVKKHEEDIITDEANLRALLLVDNYATSEEVWDSEWDELLKGVQI